MSEYHGSSPLLARRTEVRCQQSVRSTRMLRLVSLSTARLQGELTHTCIKVSGIYQLCMARDLLRVEYRHLQGPLCP